MIQCSNCSFKFSHIETFSFHSSIHEILSLLHCFQIDPNVNLFYIIFSPIFSPGRGGVRTITGAVHAADEAQHKRLRGTDAQDLRLEAEHEGHPMNWALSGGVLGGVRFSRPLPTEEGQPQHFYTTLIGITHHRRVHFSFVLILNCV